jgi:hypothetical protein
MGALSRLLRKPKVTEAYCLLNSNINKKLILIDLVSKQSPGIKQNSMVDKTVYITEHAFLRWNERVGPQYSEAKELEILLNSILSLPFRITWLNPTVGIIDSDIIFISEIINNIVIIKTFYGRKSLNPSLNQFETLRNYNSYEDEKVNLSLPPEILNKQLPPPIPIEIIRFSGRTIEYCLEHYITDENRPFFYLKHIKDSRLQETNAVNITEPKQPLLNRSALYILYLLGYRDFVLDHLTHHKPDAVEESYQKFEEKRKARLVEGATQL